MTENSKTCFIQMRLTVFNLPILLLANLVHSKTMFVVCGERIARLFGPMLLKLGIEQLSEHDYYLDGTFNEGQKNAVVVGKHLAKRNKRLLHGLRDEERNLGYRELVMFCFIETWSSFAFIQPFIQKFLSLHTNSFSLIRVWGAEAALIELGLEPLPKNVIIIKGVPVVGHIFDAMFKLGRIIFVLTLPFINFALIVRKGIKPSLSKLTNRSPEKRILFLHRHLDYDPDQNAFRDMYMLRKGVLSYGQCVHSPMSTSQNFHREKKEFLTSQGGNILEPQNLRISISDLFVTLVRDHIRFLSAAIPDVLFNFGINRKFLTKYLEYCHLRLISRALLDASGVDIVVAENEHQSITRAMGMAARSKSVRMVTMIHGSGAQTLLTLARAFSWADYYIVEGNEFEALSNYSPSIRYIYPAGCIELSACKPAPDLLPQNVVRNRESFKVVAFLMNLRTNFVNMHSMWSGSHYSDPRKIERLVSSQLKPLFEWFAEDERIILVWSTKPRFMHENPFLRSLVEKIPADRLVINHDHHMGNVIAVSDMCLASSASTAVTVSMLYGKPTVAHDMFYGGREAKWNPRMVGENGLEFAENAKYVLENGLPDSAYEAVQWSMHGDAPIDLSSETRISALFDTLLESDGLYPKPPIFYHDND